MTTSPKNTFLVDALNSDTISLAAFSYFRERFRDRLYDLVLEEFLKQEAECGLTAAEVARRSGYSSEQIIRWFNSSEHWTLETASDLFLAVSKSEPDLRLMRIETRALGNDLVQKSRSQPLSMTVNTRPHAVTPPQRIINGQNRTRTDESIYPQTLMKRRFQGSSVLRPHDGNYQNQHSRQEHCARSI